MSSSVTSQPPASVSAEPAPVGSHDEYSPLTEVVVGTAEGARIPPLERSAWLNLYPDLGEAELAEVATGAFPPRMIEEAAQDLDQLAELLETLGVRVFRPEPMAHDREFGTPHWRTSGFYSYCPRDLALVVGSTIIAAPSPMRSRMFELGGLRELFQRRMLAGSVWISAPQPQLRDELFPIDAQGRIGLGEIEPVFDAANVLRCGSDLFYLVSASGNELGYRWLQTTLSALGNYRVHPIRGVYPYTHIDSTISLLREGLVLLNPERIRDPAQLPEPLRSWEHLWCPPMAATAPSSRHPLSSTWIGMNLLMVRPDLAIVDAAQQDLIALLQRNGIDVVPHTLRHARAMGGGFHCVTLDLRRERPRDAAPVTTWIDPPAEPIGRGFAHHDATLALSSDRHAH